MVMRWGVGGGEQSDGIIYKERGLNTKKNTRFHGYEVGRGVGDGGQNDGARGLKTKKNKKFHGYGGGGWGRLMELEG